ncbi:unnamed protein product [Heligmosomoides polygyrus]|uniref:Uncharacterized protein n=1 Tax=Heligmosomoides polygyrus TaxID=6339 RepID=A0A183FLC5_HELPZ|nr:unnamed protein product [Heligmosomoides polygyrus]
MLIKRPHGDGVSSSPAPSTIAGDSSRLCVWVSSETIGRRLLLLLLSRRAKDVEDDGRPVGRLASCLLAFSLSAKI